MSEHLPLFNPFPVVQMSGHCVVCKKMLGPSPDLKGRTCFQLPCQQELRRRTSQGFGQPKCSHCSISITIHQHGTGGICGDPHCQNARLHQQQQETAKRHFLAKQQRIAALKQQMKGLIASAAHFLEIPAFQRGIVPLAESRRELLHTHLRKLFEAIESAQSALITDTPDDPISRQLSGDVAVSLSSNHSTKPTTSSDTIETLLPTKVSPEVALPVDDKQDAATTSDVLIGHACRTCQGFCCRRGEDHAYLKVDTIESIMQQHPTLSPDAIIKHYLSSLSDEVHDGSCIFHAATGCRLTADWRSTTCNDYFCGPMHSFLARPPQPGQDIVALATSEKEIIRAARYNQNEYHPLDISALAPPKESS